jgi:hypothetical protein
MPERDFLIMSRYLSFILAAAIIASTGAAVASDVKIPRDAASGLPTGKRMHKPMTITKDWATEAEARAECDSMQGTLSSANGKFSCTTMRESPTLPSTKN